MRSIDPVAAVGQDRYSLGVAFGSLSEWMKAIDMEERPGLDMVHVPYRGAAPEVADLIGGQVHVIFDNLPGSIEHIRAGNLRALAVTTARAVALPDVPT